MSRGRLILLAMLLPACGKHNADVVLETDPPATLPRIEEPPGPRGFVGSPCESDEDCPYEGSTCIQHDEGYSNGMCSLPCDRMCPDAPDHPVTFCVDDTALPGPSIGDGACHARCDFGYYPDSGCRPGYGCQRVPRANEHSTELYACLPGESDALPDCYYELAEAGVRFEPTVFPDRSPDGHPELTCHVEAPIIIRPPMHGVEVLSSDFSSVGLTGSCELGHALSDTVLDAQANGAVSLIHLGTYNCRTIAGSSNLSEHGNGSAIDIWGFEMEDGSLYTLIDDWEHDTASPASPAAAWLYASAYRWYDEGYWNTILTPNYNDAHDNHFHVDLAPGNDLIRSADHRYIGPAPYVD